MEYGDLIGHFKGKKKSMLAQVTYQWPWVLIIGGLTYKTIDNLIVGREITLETWGFLFLLCSLAMYMCFVHNKTSEIKLTAYSRGILVPFVGFSNGLNFRLGVYYILKKRQLLVLCLVFILISKIKTQLLFINI
jgi:hypothetical protein